MTYREIARGSEGQGPFAPEILPDTADNVVFYREFTNGEKVITVTAAPTIPDRYLPGMFDNGPHYGDMPADAFDVSVCTEVRDYGDESGDTSEYEWDWANHVGLTFEQAVFEARGYVSRIDPERDFA